MILTLEKSAEIKGTHPRKSSLNIQIVNINSCFAKNKQPVLHYPLCQPDCTAPGIILDFSWFLSATNLALADFPSFGLCKRVNMTNMANDSWLGRTYGQYVK